MSASKWSNRFSFILTTAAFAVGLGNIWRFPYIVGEGGGAAFLMIYLLLVLLIGIPIMLIEIALGRKAETTPMVGYGRLSHNKMWNGIGWMGVSASIIIMSYYVMILAWIVMYLWDSLAGNFADLEANALSTHFDTVASNTIMIIAVVLAIMISALLIVRQGLKVGLEKYSKWMMVGLILLLLFLTIWSASLDNASQGYRWFLYPDFSKVDLDVIMSALGQLFFSIGVGMAVAFVFGSYTTKKENLISCTIWIVLADTFFAILAGLLIFPVIFSFGLTPDSGPNLIFVTMASAFNSIPYGTWIGAVFFLLLFLSGFTSLISTVQGIKDSLKDKFELTNSKALWCSCGVILLLSVPVVFSYSEDPIMIFGKTVFGFFDFLTNNIMLPLGGLLIVIFAGHVIGYDKMKDHIQLGADNLKISSYWKPIVKYIIPSAILIILIRGILLN